MRAALRDRIKRAGVMKVALARSFNLTVSSTSHFQALDNFMYNIDKRGNGPSFNRRLQENFWGICEFLKDEISKREDGPLGSTEEFVVALLREGTVHSPEEQTRKLRQLSEFCRGCNPDAPARP
jgi:hypothetical protein